MGSEAYTTCRALLKKNIKLYKKVKMHLEEKQPKFTNFRHLKIPQTSQNPEKMPPYFLQYSFLQYTFCH